MNRRQFMRAQGKVYSAAGYHRGAGEAFNHLKTFKPYQDMGLGITDADFPYFQAGYEHVFQLRSRIAKIKENSAEQIKQYLTELENKS